MIQELLGGERKMSLNGGVVLQNITTTPTSHSPSSSTITTTNNTPNLDQNQNNLRCPRCDSSNTKFCYYNNYNLTQPRHFCKTCRRYWTKGGTLRNVPIGGGCRKNKNTCISTPIGKPVGVNKVAKIGIQYGYDHHEFSLNDTNNNSNPLLWASPQNSHILALLRSAQNPNLNPNQVVASSITVKDEGNYSNGCNMMNDSSVTTGAFNALTLGLDPFISQVPSFWRNSQNQAQQQNGFNINAGEVVQNTGIQDLYERLRSSSNSIYYGADHPTSSTSFLDSAPAGGGGGNGLGYWNSAYSTWSSDLPTTNGAYP